MTALVLHTATNFVFYRDVATHYDRRITVAVAPLLLLNQFACGAGCATAVVGELFDRVFRRGSES